jgi:hypothetical protein
VSNEAAHGRIQFSSTHRNGAFIRWAWAQRGAMPSGAREGMVQALYTSMIGHVEGLLSEALLTEYRHVMLVTNHHLARHEAKALQLVGSTVLQLMLQRQRDLEKMTFEKLMEEAELIFSGRFAEATKYKPDLSAMRHLRNLFVHGRAAWLPIAEAVSQRIDTDKTPLKQAVDRLIVAGVLSSDDVQTMSEFMAADESRLFSKLHSDEAVMYFYQGAKRFEEAIFAIPDLPLESPVATRLPDLDAL